MAGCVFAIINFFIKLIVVVAKFLFKAFLIFGVYWVIILQIPTIIYSARTNSYIVNLLFDLEMYNGAAYRERNLVTDGVWYWQSNILLYLSFVLMAVTLIWHLVTAIKREIIVRRQRATDKKYNVISNEEFEELVSDGTIQIQPSNEKTQSLLKSIDASIDSINLMNEDNISSLEDMTRNADALLEKISNHTATTDEIAKYQRYVSALENLERIESEKIQKKLETEKLYDKIVNRNASLEEIAQYNEHINEQENLRRVETEDENDRKSKRKRKN